MQSPNYGIPPEPGIRNLVASFMQGFSIEITPGTARKVGDFRDTLKPGTTVYVTCLPGSNLRDSIEASKKLAVQGMNVVPHFTARRFCNEKDLEAGLAELTQEAGVKQVLAIAGADRQPVGIFPDTMSMIETGLFDKYRIGSIGMAGHPEGNPLIDKHSLCEHGLRKLSYSRRTDAHIYIVTQFLFESGPLIEWARKIRGLGSDLPIMVGIPGLATLRSLIKHAQDCGVGPSVAMLRQQARNVSKLLTWQEPDRFVLKVARHAQNHPEDNLSGAHVYPLGGLSRSAAWSYAAAQGNLTPLPNGNGFHVNVDLA